MRFAATPSRAQPAGVLFTGLWAMGSDDETDAGYSNLLMRWRAGMQGLTVALMALNFVLTGAWWNPPNEMSPLGG